MKNIKYSKTKVILFFVTISLFSLFSCRSKTIEEKVEDLIKSENSEERKNLATELADSLSVKPLELLFGVYYNPDVKESIQIMYDRYIFLASENNKKAFELIDLITLPNKIISLDVEERIGFILYGIKSGSNSSLLTNHLANNLKRYGDIPIFYLVEEWKKSRLPIFLDIIKSYKMQAVNYLIEKLGDDKDVNELLGYMGELSFDKLKEKMKDKDQQIRFGAADALVYMYKYHPEIVKSLIDVLENDNTRLIAKNYPFYIRMGLQGTEDLLLKVLDKHFTEQMCLDYLNCGNKYIEERSKSIAEKKGYVVYSLIGEHYGPKWGEGN